MTTQHLVQQIDMQNSSRVKIIALIQICAGLAGIITRILYGSTPLQGHLLFVSISAITIILGLVFYFFLESNIWLHSRMPRRPLRNNNAIDKDEFINMSCTILMMIDAVLCSILVACSGGLKDSAYAALLFAIVSIAFVLQLPRKMIFVVTLSVIITSVICYFTDQFDCPFFKNILEASSENRKPWFFTGTVALLLTVLGSIEHLCLRTPKSKLTTALNLLHNDILYSGISGEGLMKGIRHFMHDLGRKNYADICLSKVHDLSTILYQGIMLLYPHQQGESAISTKKMSPKIMYSILAIHWIDDFFDEKIFTDSNKLDFNKELRQLFHSSRHLNRILTRLMKRTRANESQKDLITKGLKRLVLGGVMQHRNNEDEIKTMLKAHCTLAVSSREDICIKKEYENLLKSTDHWIIIWATSKNVCGIFDCLGDEYINDSSELYSIFFVPFAIYLNFEKEYEKEEFSDSFKKVVLKTEDFPPPDLEERLIKCFEIFESNLPVIKSEKADQIDGRKRQLRSLMTLYEKQLPNMIRKRYQAILDDASIWESSKKLPKSGKGERTGSVL